jgi:hypothetical protein
MPYAVTTRPVHGVKEYKYKVDRLIKVRIKFILPVATHGYYASIYYGFTYPIFQIRPYSMRGRPVRFGSIYELILCIAIKKQPLPCCVRLTVHC